MYLITKLLILEHYIFYIIGLILAIYFIIKILKYIIKKENIFTDKKAAEFAKEWMKKYPLRYNIAIIIIMSLWIFFVIYVGIIMYLKELPNIIKNKYEIEECIVENAYTKSDRLEEQSIYCKNDNGDTIHFSYYGELISEGLKIKVYYYKHIEIGQIVEIIE